MDDREHAVTHLLELGGTGPVWGVATEDLNATLLVWPAGGGTPEDVNVERDVLVVVLAGSGTLELDGVAHPLAAGDAMVVPKGTRRRILAGAEGIRYLTAHLKRGGLQISPRAS